MILPQRQDRIGRSPSLLKTTAISRTDVRTAGPVPSPHDICRAEGAPPSPLIFGVQACRRSCSARGSHARAPDQIGANLGTRSCKRSASLRLISALRRTDRASPPLPIRARLMPGRISSSQRRPAERPILMAREWLEPGQHLTAMGIRMQSKERGQAAAVFAPRDLRRGSNIADRILNGCTMPSRPAQSPDQPVRELRP